MNIEAGKMDDFEFRGTVLTVAQALVTRFPRMSDREAIERAESFVRAALRYEAEGVIPPTRVEA